MLVGWLPTAVSQHAELTSRQGVASCAAVPIHPSRQGAARDRARRGWVPAGQSPADIKPELELSVELQREILEFDASLDRPYHVLLGVARDADSRAIKRAYFQLSKKFHPDRYFRSELGEFAIRLDRIFNRIVEAYELLSDPTTRSEIERSKTVLDTPSRGENLVEDRDFPSMSWTRIEGDQIWIEGWHSLRAHP